MPFKLVLKRKSNVFALTQYPPNFFAKVQFFFLKQVACDSLIIELNDFSSALSTYQTKTISFTFLLNKCIY